MDERKHMVRAAAMTAFCLSVSVAFGATSQWFDAGISEYDSWPANVECGTWTNASAATLSGEAGAKRLDVDADIADPLLFEPTNANSSAIVAVESTMRFGGAFPSNDLPAVAADVKYALIVVDEGGGALKYYGLVKSAADAPGTFVPLDGATPDTTKDVVARISRKDENGSFAVRYEVDGVSLANSAETWIATLVAESAVRQAGFAGSVSVASLSGSESDMSGTTATLTIPELPANVVATVATNGVPVELVEGVYLVEDGATVVVTFAAESGYVLSGAPVSAIVVVNGDTTLPAASVPTAITPAQAVSINEIMASNPSLDKGGITNGMGIAEMDWLELYNAASVDIDATGWYLTDNDKVGKETKATIFGSCVIPAGGYKIVWLDKTHTNAAEYAANEAFAVIKLSSGGDLIKLSDAAINLVDKVDFTTKPQIKGYSYGPGKVSYGPLAGTGSYVYMKTATPGAANVTEGWGDFTPAVTFSEPHGYKTEAFELTLSCADMPAFEGAAIYYTLDGSSPTLGAAKTHLYTGPITITNTTIVRAAVPIEGSILQFDASATYVYLDEILAQGRTTSQPTGIEPYFPNTGVNGQKMLYGMLQLTGEDRERLLRGFTNSIATLSVVVDPQNLFNSSTGIYVNAKGEGEGWERQIMLEGFDPTGVGADFAQPAGIRIRGGNSRQGNHAKHALRFFFRSSYGVSSLKAKMFPGESVKEAGEYDKLDLRCSQNVSWAYNETASGNDKKDTFVTEVFSRDSQRDLGQPYTRSRYCNLFINGQYWGLYQTQERGDEHFAESYLGGDSLQYDLIKASSTYASGSLGYLLECNEGTWDAWESLREIATTQGFAGDYTNNYMRILGLNPDGTRNPAYPILLNQESLMAFMLVTHFVVDRDGPTSPYSGIDKGHVNNFYALRNRNDAGDVNGFVFLRHDAEISMGQHSDCEASDNPTYWGTEACTVFTGATKHRQQDYFNPAELHYLLMQNPDYKRAYADYFYQACLREGGAMTVEKATERYTSRMNEITDAIVCEQARWAQNGQTRQTWLNACGTSTTFITNRLDYMKSQYQAVGWYPSIEPPTVVDKDGGRYFDGGEVPYHEKVYLASTVADGAIYYTTNGVDDPMDAGIAYTGAFDIPDAGFTVRARVLKAGEWSALEEVALEADVPNDQRYGIRIAAILNAAVNDPADEFIVLTNTLGSAVSLEGLSIWSEKAGKALTKLTEVGAGVELAAGGTITLTRAEYWPDPTETIKLKNGEIYVELRDFNGKRIQNARVDSEKWFLTDPENAKSGACNKTGRWFIALEFLGDTDPAPSCVTNVTQWTPSPEAPAIPLPEDPTAKDEVLSVITNDAAVEGWYVGISTNSVEGYISITNFTGDATAVELCYLLNNDVLDANMSTNAAVELKIPAISFDPTTGNVLIDGKLLIHNSEVSRTVNGNVRLYYANSLEALETSTDYLQITPPAFPLNHKDAGTTENIPARFYRLKIE
ncbi:MAG: lamin tail domain-containing protein [Kiritimatiellae bacterium]|nr:lamin tail domain-containing protein [Kiritimatiellia bacterium]